MTPNSLIVFLSSAFTFNELRDLALSFNVEWSDLPGETIRQKARELVVYADRHGFLENLTDEVKRRKPKYFEDRITLGSLQRTSEVSIDSAERLQNELAALRQQLQEIQQGRLGDRELEEKIAAVVKTTNQAIGRTEELTTRILLPPPQLTEVKLVPSGALERVEEYRSDEKIAFLLMGLFLGGIVGVLVNWATNDPLTITRFSIVIVCFLATLATGTVYWAYRIAKRVESVRKRYFGDEILGYDFNKVDLFWSAIARGDWKLHLGHSLKLNKLGNRPALEWVIDQYRASLDGRSGIKNDPNRPEDETYILRLIGQVVTVSLETVKVVKGLPGLEMVQAEIVG
jgi:hypothetical protein